MITNQALARLDAPVDAARRDLAAAQAAARAVPAKIPLTEHNPDMVKLDTETKLITHAIRMAACNTETILARALNGCYARAGDEAYALIREALHASGDITIHGSTLHIRLDPLSAPRRTRALAALCEQLTTTATRYPGTQPPPAIRSQRTPRHCMNYCAMSGALGPQCRCSSWEPTARCRFSSASTARPLRRGLPGMRRAWRAASEPG